VHVAAFTDGGHFNARYKLHAGGGTCGGRRIASRCRIVIGDGQDGNAGACRARHKFGRRGAPVRRGRVSMEIDQRADFAARAGAARRGLRRP